MLKKHDRIARQAVAGTLGLVAVAALLLVVVWHPGTPSPSANGEGRTERNGRLTAPSVGGAPHEDPRDSAFHGWMSGTRTLLAIEFYAYMSVALPKGEAWVGFEWLQHLSTDPTDPIWSWLATVGGSSSSPGTHAKTAIYRTSYSPELAVARDSEDLVLAGHPINVAGVMDLTKISIERWRLRYPDGSPHLRRATSQEALGTPVAYSPPVLGVDTPPFQACDLLDAPTETRAFLYYGSTLAGTNAMAVDPDGRFLLCSTSAGDLYQLPLTPNAQPTLLFTSAQVAALATATRIEPRQHQDHGRIYIIPRGPLPGGVPDDAGWNGDFARSVLVDGDNDGVFEHVHEIPDWAWLSSDYGDESLWVDGFDRKIPL